MSEASKRTNADPVVRLKNSQGVKAAWQRPGYRDKAVSSMKASFDQERCGQLRERMEKVWKTKEHQDKVSGAIKARWAAYSDEERSARIVKQREAYTAELRSQIKESVASYWDRPGVREAHAEKLRVVRNTPEAKARQRQRMLEVWASKEERVRRGNAIAKAHNSEEGKRKLQQRRRRGETIEQWQARNSKDAL